MPFEQLWPMIVCAIILIGGIGTAIYMLVTGKTKVQEYLLGILTEMRRITGEPLILNDLQIAEIYNSFVTGFPGLAKFITLGSFKSLLGKSLELMENLISENEACALYMAKRDK